MKLNIQILGPPGRKLLRNSYLGSLETKRRHTLCRTTAKQLRYALNPERPIFRLGLSHTDSFSLKPLAMVRLAFASAGASNSICFNNITTTISATAHSPPTGRGRSTSGGLSPPRTSNLGMKENSPPHPTIHSLRHNKFSGTPPRFDQGRDPPRAIAQTLNWNRAQ